MDTGAYLEDAEIKKETKLFLSLGTVFLLSQILGFI